MWSISFSLCLLRYFFQDNLKTQEGREKKPLNSGQNPEKSHPGCMHPRHNAGTKRFLKVGLSLVITPKVSDHKKN